MSSCTCAAARDEELHGRFRRGLTLTVLHDGGEYRCFVDPLLRHPGFDTAANWRCPMTGVTYFSLVGAREALG